ncbi:Proteasome activator complex subunit 3 [Trichuris trichiura]|uniref:Proteasome activator complex subunit 3 n=1 Tax=Trichuris trichiura TaxID=36087 RepID=A0A077ZGN4_TRITR|nr:Proteasome activator complex subunit 3 [Trichuris trichiura]
MWEAIKPMLSEDSLELDVPIPCALNWADTDILNSKGIIACEQILKTRENGVDVPDPIAEHAAKSEKTKLADQISKEVRNYLADEFGKIPELDTLITMNIEEAEKLLAEELRRKLESGQFVPPLELSPIEYSPGQPPPFERSIYENATDLEFVAENTPLSLTDCPKEQDCFIANPTEMGVEPGAATDTKPIGDVAAQDSQDPRPDLSTRMSPSKRKSLFESLIATHASPTANLLIEERENLGEQYTRQHVLHLTICITDEKLSRMLKRFACLSSSSRDGSSATEDPSAALNMADKGKKKNGKVLTKEMDPSLKVDGLENEYFSHGEPVHPNMELQVIQQVLRRELTAAANDCTNALLWIHLHLEQLEDKTSEYYSQFLQVLTAFKEKRADVMDRMSKIKKFHQERAKLGEDIIKYPHIEDYRLALNSLDARQYAECHRCLANLAEFYLSVFTGVLREIKSQQ